MTMSPRQAIELLGGCKAVADDAAKPLTTVSSWVSRQSIPVAAWPHLLAMAEKKRIAGFSYAALVAMHSKAKAPPEARPRRRAKAA